MNDATIKSITGTIKTAFAELGICSKHPHQKDIASCVVNNVFTHMVSMIHKKEQEKSDKLPKQVTVNTTAPVVIKELKKEGSK